MQNDGLRILSNLRFHESPEWCARTRSIYPDHGASDSTELSPLREAIALWHSAPACDAVVTMGDRTSLLYGLLCALTSRTSRQIFSELLIETDARGVRARAKRALFRIAAKGALGLLASSTAERRSQGAYLGIPETQCLFVPLNANRIQPGSEVEPDLVVAAGRSGRDYETLINALDGLPIRAKLFTGATDLPAGSVSDRVTIEREVSYDTYLAGLRRAGIVVVPLRPTTRATGQVVVLEAMALGKAVIATRTPGTVDYIDPGRTGFLIDPGDVDGLRGHLTELSENPALRARIGEAARQAAETRFSIATHTRSKLAAIEELVQSAHAKECKRS